MRYEATYKDDRDADESAVCETDTLKSAWLGLFEYFTRTGQMQHAESATVTNVDTGNRQTIYFREK